MSTLLAPASLAEALAIRADVPEAVPVAGGTDLMVAVNFGRARPAALLDLSRVEELQEWSVDGAAVRVGAGVTFARIARELPELHALAAAALSVGSPQVRNRATIGGNVATGSPAGDSLPVLAAYGADVVTASSVATRKIPLPEFLLGPKHTALRPDELIVGLEWRQADGPGAFTKVGPRNAMVIAVAGVALQVDRPARSLRLALGSVAPTVVRAPEAEAFGAAVVRWDDPEAPLPDEAAREFGRLAALAASPIDDVRGSAAYRRHVVGVLARRLLQEAIAC